MMETLKQIQQAAGEKVTLAPAATGAIVLDGKILLVRRGPLDQWQLPGGLQEPGEAIQDTVRRILRQLLGVNLQVRDLIAIYSSPCWEMPYAAGSRSLQPVLFFFGMQGQLGEITMPEDHLWEFSFFPVRQIPEDIVVCCRQQIHDLLHFDGNVFLR